MEDNFVLLLKFILPNRFLLSLQIFGKFIFHLLFFDLYYLYSLSYFLTYFVR